MQPTKTPDSTAPKPFARRVVVSVSLDPNLIERLRQEVRFGKSISKIVEAAIRKYLDE